MNAKGLRSAARGGTAETAPPLVRLELTEFRRGIIMGRESDAGAGPRKGTAADADGEGSREEICI